MRRVLSPPKFTPRKEVALTAIQAVRYVNYQQPTRLKKGGDSPKKIKWILYMLEHVRE